MMQGIKFYAQIKTETEQQRNICKNQAKIKPAEKNNKIQNKCLNDLEPMRLSYQMAKAFKNT